MTHISHRHPDYKEQVKTECLNYLHSLCCAHYFNGVLFDRFYSVWVKNGMRSISSLAAQISDEIIHKSAPMPPIEEEI